VPDMNDRQSIDRGLLIPIILGIFSIFGICLVLVLGRIASSRASVTPEDTATPFLYLFIGTEPAVVSATPEDDEEDDTDITRTPRATATEVSLLDPLTALATETDSSLIILATPTSTTSSSTAPLNPGTYDNDDPHLVYEGDWNVQTGVSGVFEGTLHVSSTLGNSVTFRFIGQQIRIFYQSGSGLGTVQIDLDGVEFELSQSDNSTAIAEWSSPVLINGTHTVSITHLSGGAINIDQVIVPDVLVTPTVSPTP
jgi:hypothetical protein